MTDTIIERQLSLSEAVIPQALAIRAMKDSGYKNTAFALAELIDNSIQAGANDVTVACIEKPKMVNERMLRSIDSIGVIDNGDGMSADTLRIALQFGNGTRLNSRKGIGRFGMGLPNSSISQALRVDVWSWQAGPDNALHTYLDVPLIEQGKQDLVPSPAASSLPEEWRGRFDSLGTTGTLVVWSNFEPNRLSWKTARTTLEHTEDLIARVYRKFIANGKITIRMLGVDENNEHSIDVQAKPNDPLYLIAPSNTPSKFSDTPMFQPWGENHEVFKIPYGDASFDVTVRMSWARPETVVTNGKDRGAMDYGKHAARNIGVSVVRAGRELDLDHTWANSYNPVERWWGVEVEFPPELDEVFGVTNNKQAATIFSQMSDWKWKDEAETGETFMDLKRRMEDEEDSRVKLIEIQQYISDQLSLIRTRLGQQTSGLRGGGSRHPDAPEIEDLASAKWKDRANSGHTVDSDGETFDEASQEQMLIHLTEDDDIPLEEARRIVESIKDRERVVHFVESPKDSPAFFSTDLRPGGVTEIVFNSRHPVFEQLFSVLEHLDVETATDAELIERVVKGSETLKLLFAAWARYEQEDIPARARLEEIRWEWGKMATHFLTEPGE